MPEIVYGRMKLPSTKFIVVHTKVAIKYHSAT
jgi:hypothetical protein